MSMCTVCGRVYCDHHASERGQTHDEVMRPLTPFEVEVWRSGDDEKKRAQAREYAHYPGHRNGHT